MLTYHSPNQGVNRLGSPGALTAPAGKYREVTLLRQRGGADDSVPYPLVIS